MRLIYATANLSTASLAAASLAAVCLCCTAAGAAMLTEPKPLAKDVDALPKLTAQDAVSSGLNKALQKLDKKVLEARKTCISGKNTSWTRTVTTTMAGPQFLSFYVTDSAYCGGAHPDAASIALVYDLKTGKAVDWSKLLPKALVETSTLDTAADGSTIGVIGSKKLSQLYIEGLGKDIDKDCKQALAETELKFIIWLDDGHQGQSAQGQSKQGQSKPGLGVQTTSLPHATQACADTVTLRLAQLQQIGPVPRLGEAFSTTTEVK